MEIAEAIGNDYSASLLANDAQFVLLRIFVRWIINEVRVQCGFTCFEADQMFV